MFTCRTCKLLKHSKAKRDICQYKDDTIIVYKGKANSFINSLSEWYCPFYWWSIRPPIGSGCMHWQNMNGKHWI